MSFRLECPGYSWRQARGGTITWVHGETQPIRVEVILKWQLSKKAQPQREGSRTRCQGRFVFFNILNLGSKRRTLWLPHFPKIVTLLLETWKTLHMSGAFQRKRDYSGFEAGFRAIAGSQASLGLQEARILAA